jgi:hypothetical protein
MKNSIDVVAQRIFATFFGLALFTFALGTITNNGAKANKETTAESTGKIMMHQNSFVHDGGYYYHILVWDSETGKSKLYNMDNGNLIKTSYNLPSSPLY